MELGKPIHHKSFAVTCNASYVSDYLTYHWKVNGADLNDTNHIQANSSTLIYTNLTMMDNLSKLVCHLGIRNSGSVTCNCSSEESESYTVLFYYGPINISLTVNRSDIYLQDNEMLEVKCWANCYPDCTYKWESNYINVDNNGLIINSFKERMSGIYTCTARNRETGVTSKSNPIFLHHTKGLPPEQYWMGPIIVSVFLLIVGFGAFMIHCWKNTSRDIDSKNYGRSCSKGGKKGVFSKRSTSERQYTNVARSKTCPNDDHNTCTRSQDLRNSLEYPGPNFRENKYSTTDEAVFSVYDYASDNGNNGYSHETGIITEQSLYDYASPIETCCVVTADIHVAFENYITPIHYPVIPIEMCDSGQNDVLRSERTCITPSRELTNSINEINVHDSDLNIYLTPIA
ncbi:hypothetical protein CHS0354_038634 [Potamilus streckersoni]|nr:hypothetical protein CHS0354_038634 [Potamilus streckersoni]